MEQIYFGERIAAYRKAQWLTQEALAQKLGVTNQAVSKWESDQCCPDIMLLPALADVFGVTIDALFGRETPAPVEEPAQDTAQTDERPAGLEIGELPWPDDGALRAVCYVGRRMVQFGDRSAGSGIQIGPIHLDVGAPSIELHYSGDVAGSIYAQGSVLCESATVGGDVHAEESVRCGNVGGGVTAGDGVSCGDVGGGVTAGDSVNCGDVGGSVSAGDGVRCGHVEGNVTAGDSVFCAGVKGRVWQDDE